MVRTLSGDECVGVSKQDEYGWVPLELLPDAEQSLVFNGLPKAFHSFAFHSDEVFSVPETQFRVTIRSPNCSVQAFDVLDAPMWGVQFHPERVLDLGEQSLARLKSREPTKKLINAERSKELYDKKIAQIIFRAFLAQVWQSRG
jgi:GMP synthase-like glutamine amidotransferase